MITKELLLQELKDILVENGYVNANTELTMETDLIKDLKISDENFMDIILKMQQKHKDVIPERDARWYGYSFPQKPSRAKQVILWAYSWLTVYT